MHQEWNSPLAYSAVVGCHYATTIDDLKVAFQTVVREVVPHDMAGFGICDLASHRILLLCNVDFPPEYAAEATVDGVLHSPVAAAWNRQRRPQRMDVRPHDCKRDAYWLAARKHGLKSIMGCGQVDLQGSFATYFTVASKGGCFSPQDLHVFSLLVPHLHAALTAVKGIPLAREAAAPVPASSSADHGIEALGGGSPSKRELEILAWICLGKTNDEIGRILSISEFTVKNHVQRILAKLGVQNRTQAATRALSLGLVDHQAKRTIGVAQRLDMDPKDARRLAVNSNR